MLTFYFASSKMVTHLESIFLFLFVVEWFSVYVVIYMNSEL